ncbi:MAG: hypothetical protein FWC76_05440 [Defluviitaleaceae bacterium]|nr:hypothetical protein [Defluviitaleaceae bacterium]
MKIIIALLLLALIFTFPQVVGAKEADAAAGPCIEARALLVFSEIFDNADNLYYVPLDVRVFDVFFHAEYAHLVINLSPEVLNYGGTHFEWEFVRILLINASSIEGVGYFTVLIDGQRRCLPEGTEIHEIRVYPESLFINAFHPAAPLSFSSLPQAALPTYFLPSA